ncbi:hypothetical protein KI387_008293 [Taxus chinensis]|uniref:Uncharacterized protein n=1 Tax=Taxus chinensis TaxID=29808 RepID=A0AA38CX63_TAXCH|nr:hypothetical protein KI387_008293 [Taxus chinensis]
MAVPRKKWHTLNSVSRVARRVTRKEISHIPFEKRQVEAPNVPRVSIVVVVLSGLIILSINPEAMRMVIKPSNLMNNSYQTRDMQGDGVQLNQSLPFNITSTNTVMYLNCNSILLRSPLNCSDNSPCHRFIDEVGEANVCRNTSLCCSFTAGGSLTSYRIRVWRGGCRGYTSVLNYNPALPLNQWMYGVEIMWVAPREPSCATQGDCDQKLVLFA